MSAQPEPDVLASVGAALAQAVFRAADLLYGPWTIAGMPVPSSSSSSGSGSS